MKKILLGTTTLIGAAGLFASAALAETPKVTLGGFENFEVGVVGDQQDSAGKVGGVDQRPEAFRSDTTVNVRVDGKSDAGLGYGGGVDLQADTSVDANNGGLNARKTFIYLEGGAGRFELGSEVGAESTMKVDAASIARGTGGIDGDWTFFANNRPTVGGANATINGGASRFVATPDLPVSYGFRNDTTGFGDESQENVNKVTYYTPRFAGFQLGVSFLPDDNSRGQTINRTRTNLQNGIATGAAGSITTVSDIVTGGINYDTKWDQFGITLAGTGEWGKAQHQGYDNLAAWNAGAKVTLVGFSVAASYGDWGNSYRLKADGANDTTYWTAGGSYEWGPFGASVTYLQSDYDNAAGAASGDNKFHNLSFGTDWKLAPGLTPYAELDFYHEDYGTASVVPNNTGRLFLAGTQLAF